MTLYIHPTCNRASLQQRYRENKHGNEGYEEGCKETREEDREEKVSGLRRSIRGTRNASPFFCPEFFRPGNRPLLLPSSCFLTLRFAQDGAPEGKHHCSSDMVTDSAAMAAVSARRMVCPKEAEIQPQSSKIFSSGAVQPPSGPIARWMGARSTDSDLC